MDMPPAFAACAELVERGDPDRYRATMAAPPHARAPLFVLYAFNLEIARAPWVTKEPLIARMRLQFWRDTIEGEDTRAHEVAAPLAALIRKRALSKSDLLAMIDAREAEVGAQAPFDTEYALWRFLQGSAGALMALGVQALGGSGGHAGARDIGTAQGLANYLRAIPALEAAGRRPVPDGRAATLAALAQQGAALFDRGRADLRRNPVPGAARAALLAAWETRAILVQAAREPDRIAQGALGTSEFAQRGRLLWATIKGI